MSTILKVSDVSGGATTYDAVEFQNCLVRRTNTPVTDTFPLANEIIPNTNYGMGYGVTFYVANNGSSDLTINSNTGLTLDSASSLYVAGSPDKFVIPAGKMVKFIFTLPANGVQVMNVYCMYVSDF